MLIYSKHTYKQILTWLRPNWLLETKPKIESTIRWKRWKTKTTAEEVNALSVAIFSMVSCVISASVKVKYQSVKKHLSGTSSWHCLQGYSMTFSPSRRTCDDDNPFFVACLPLSLSFLRKILQSDGKIWQKCLFNFTLCAALPLIPPWRLWVSFIST